MIGRREHGNGEAEALSGDKDAGGSDTEDSEDGDVMTGQCWQGWGVGDGDSSMVIITVRVMIAMVSMTVGMGW